MAYNALNNLIDAYIYANGVQAITGQILNGVLKQMVSQLGSGYHLMGVAGPETVPASNDYAMAYFAATAGEYTEFGGITLAAGEVAVLLTSGNGSWSKQTIYTVPTTTEDLENTAGFITNAVTDLVNYYTKTEVDDTLANYPTLEALETALADYYTKQEIDTTLEDYPTKQDQETALGDYYTKDEMDAALGDRYTKDETDTKLADYYKKTETYDKDEVDSIIAALSRQEYIVAWDGLTAPDVSAIPAGVTVTYSGTTYTGTLAASASTVNKIYMVWNGTAYDMYGTSQDGGYSWVPMGTTSVDLSQYATKAEVSQLEAEVTDIQDTLGYHDEPVPPPFLGYDIANTSISYVSLTPFCVALKTDESVFINKIKLDARATGPLTIGKIKKIYVSSGQPLDRSKVFDKRTLQVPQTGVQEIGFAKLQISSDEYVAIGDASDTVTFFYGSSGTDVGFFYYSGGNAVYTPSSIGVDLYGVKSVPNASGLVTDTIMGSEDLQFLLGSDIQEYVLYDGYGNPSYQSVPSNTPFVVARNVVERGIITRVKINVSTAGTLSFGKIKKARVRVNLTWDRDDVKDVVVKTLDVGEQDVELGFKVFADEYLAIGMPTDTAIFLYGGSSVDSGFLYSHPNNTYQRSVESLGINIYATAADDVKRVSTYAGKRVSILGDSISTFSGWIPSENLTYYPAGTVQSVQDTWWKKLIDALGLVLDTNNSWSGSRVTTTAGETSAGCMTRAQSLGAPDVIIVWMGINDFNAEVAVGTYDGMSPVPSVTTTFREAYGIMLDKILSTYKTAEVWVCTLPQCERNASTGFPEINGNGVCLEVYNRAIRELASSFNVKVLEHSLCGLTYQNMSVYNPDQLHPNKYGHSLVANNDIRQMDNCVSTRYAIAE